MLELEIITSAGLIIGVCKAWGQILKEMIINEVELDENGKWDKCNTGLPKIVWSGLF